MESEFVTYQYTSIASLQTIILMHLELGSYISLLVTVIKLLAHVRYMVVCTVQTNM